MWRKTIIISLLLLFVVFAVAFRDRLGSDFWRAATKGISYTGRVQQDYNLYDPDGGAIPYDIGASFDYTRDAAANTEIWAAVQGYAKNTSTDGETGGHYIGVLGYTEDTADNTFGMIGVEAKTHGLGTGSYNSFYGQTYWAGATFAQRTLISYNNELKITEADGSTPLNEGYAIMYNAAEIVGGLLKFSFYARDPMRITSQDAGLQRYIEIDHNNTNAKIVSNYGSLVLQPASGSSVVTNGGFNYGLDAGANDTYVVSIPGITAYVAGLTVLLDPNTVNAADCTLNINSLGAKSIKLPNGNNPDNGWLLADGISILVYDGVNFQIVSPDGTP